MLSTYSTLFVFFVCFFLLLQRFFLALRLIALAQNGKEVSLTNLMLLVPAPKVVSGLISLVS